MRPESDQISPTGLCPNPELWEAHDSEASETEVGDFLYGLIRLIKPRVVIETGCYMGFTSYRMASALHDNRRGYLYTCDTQADKCDETRRRLYGLPANVSLSKGVVICKCTRNVDLAFIDSNGDREEECKALQLSDNALIVVHDMNWLSLHPIRHLGWDEIFFPTPRGISLFKHEL